MHIHFIAIGGAAMHNLAIALHNKGYKVTGSDDEIFDPSKSRLNKYGLLPKEFGWFPDKINEDIDVIVLGMHARKDNPELLKAQELKLKVYSYPEYLYEQCKDKKRVAIGGSHGKTTITSMVMHVLKKFDYKFDYMVGAQIEGFETMVQLSHDAPIAIFEGDEYLSSPIDLRPKFHWYKPHIALLTGIAWDHINVFPTWDNYVSQFKIFADSLEKDASLIWFLHDEELQNIGSNLREDIKSIVYEELPSKISNNGTTTTFNGIDYNLSVFGEHNLQNINGARLVCNELGISDKDFLTAITSFKGAAKRLQTLKETENTSVFLDFAHSPSKLKATTKAVKEQYPNRQLIACMELHTFSSLNKEFLPEYYNTMQNADKAYIYFNPEVVKHKKLPEITKEEVYKAFGSDNIEVFSDTNELQAQLKKTEWKDKNLLFMSSGNFSGIDFPEFTQMLIT
ncbi:peptidoglycan synthetase [Labilibacter sediminis]|nr:peptidoglycan synthetase [Labilibacter sediminis]